MEKTIQVNNIDEYNQNNNHKTLHPLVSVLDYSKANVRDWGDADTLRFQYGLYSIVLKEVVCGDIRYGKHTYDYQAGTLVFFAPGQVAEMRNPKIRYQPHGHGLVFHPDLLIGTNLGRTISHYKFFHYESHEALHLSEDEQKMILDCFAKIEFELKQPIDKHSKKLIISNIELFLDYCQRFYDRQFITREHVNKGILERFESLMHQYFETDQAQVSGIPSVSYFANELHLSANYFGDLIKKETGLTAKDYIQNKTIDVAKNRVLDTDKTINEIAFEMGFKYPQHFTRLFKQRVGQTPNEYRSLN
jgi:AraC-like DNA-binding protein